MLTVEEKRQFSKILETLGETLDITESEYNEAVKSYNAVGEWLSKPDSSLNSYSPIIRPQGSFMLGTMIRPIYDEDDLDIDLVCQLSGKNPDWTQYDLKHKIGERLKSSEVYRRLLEEEGRRCWTLQYAESANFHMDILPSIVSNEYELILEKAFSASYKTEDLDSLAIRITDKEAHNYYVDVSPGNWLKSNPFGYGQWFFNAAEIPILQKRMLFSEAVKSVPKYNRDKLPLQRVIQILKRHRDIMFEGDEDKPISIIITTLATKAYNKESSIIDALINIVSTMGRHIEKRYDLESGREILWVSNPVNVEENFADKWVEHPQRQKNFFRWLDSAKVDIISIVQKRGLQHIAESMKRPFGDRVVTETFSSLGRQSLYLREREELKMETGTGALGKTGSVVTKTHNFHGEV